MSFTPATIPNEEFVSRMREHWVGKLQNVSNEGLEAAWAQMAEAYNSKISRNDDADERECKSCKSRNRAEDVVEHRNPREDADRDPCDDFQQEQVDAANRMRADKRRLILHEERNQRENAEIGENAHPGVVGTGRNVAAGSALNGFTAVAARFVAFVELSAAF